MNLDIIVGVIGIVVDIVLANKAMSHLDGLLKFTAGFVFVFGFIGLVFMIFSEETAGMITGIYLFALIIWYITKEE
jgi:Ca2+/Na+ antiporter